MENASGTNRRNHPLSLSWILGDKPQTTFASATSLARQSYGDAGHLMSTAPFEAPIVHKKKPSFATVDSSPSPRPQPAEPSPLDDMGFHSHQELCTSPTARMGPDDNQHAAELRVSDSGEQETHACSEHYREDDCCGQCLPSSISQHKGSRTCPLVPEEGLCPACLQWHFSSMERLKAQHQAHVEALQEQHAAMLDDARCLCEDFQVLYVGGSVGCEHELSLCHVLLNNVRSKIRSPC